MKPKLLSDPLKKSQIAEINQYIKLISDEDCLIREINAFIRNHYDNHATSLEPVFNKIQTAFTTLNSISKQQAVFIEKHFVNQQTHEQIDKIIDHVLSSSPCGAYQNTNIRKNTVAIVCAYLKYIKTPQNYNPLNKTSEVEAYLLYINTLIKRLVLNPYTEHLEKIVKILNGINCSIAISKSYAGDGMRLGHNLISSTDVYKYKDSEIATSQILNHLYYQNPRKFETHAMAKNGLYKQGRKSDVLSKLNEFKIYVDITEMYAIKLGELNQNIYYYISPDYIESTHEELHMLRTLRGACRASSNQKLPDILTLEYDPFGMGVEEFVNIKAGKNNESKIDVIYNFPCRIGHRGYSIPTEQQYNAEHQQHWHMQREFAFYVSGLKLLDNLDITQFNSNNNKYKPANDYKFYSALVAILFYGEQLDNLQTVETLVVEYLSNPNLIPNQQTPIHLLARFAQLWDIKNSLQLYTKTISDILEICLKHNIDIAQVDEHKLSPLEYAVRQENSVVINLFLTKYSRKISSNNNNRPHSKQTKEQLLKVTSPIKKRSNFRCNIQ